MMEQMPSARRNSVEGSLLQRHLRTGSGAGVPRQRCGGNVGLSGRQACAECFGRRATVCGGDWPQLPGAPEPGGAQGLDLPALTYLMSPASAPQTSPTPERTLLEQIDACRGLVADALFEASRDYQVLCNLVHEDLPACTETIETLRRRLAGNIHYAVLAKLDEAHALVAKHLAADRPPSAPASREP